MIITRIKVQILESGDTTLTLDPLMYRKMNANVLEAMKISDLVIGDKNILKNRYTSNSYDISNFISSEFITIYTKGNF